MINLKKTIRKILLTSILSVFIATISIHSSAGNSFQVTDLGSSARMIGLGNIEGFSNDANNIFENVAGIHRIDKQSLSIFTTKIMDEATYKNIALATNTEFGRYALGFMVVDVTDIPKTRKIDKSLEKIGSFKYESSLLKLGYQLSLSNELHLGTALNYYKNEIGDIVGSGFNADCGAVYQKGNLSTSLTIKNIIPSLKLNYNDNRYEDFSLQCVGAVGYKFGDFKTFLQIKTSSHQKDPLKSVGVEYKPTFLNILSLYSGIKEYYALETVKNTYTLGVGLYLMGVSFDYTYEKSDHIGFDNNNYFSLSVNVL